MPNSLLSLHLKVKAAAEAIQGRLPHQERIVQKLKRRDQPGLILMHGLGSGKTRSSIEAYKELGLPAEVVLPAALQGNYEKEVQKWVGQQPADLNIRSQQTLARNGANPEDFKGKLMIVDEAHRLRNNGSSLLTALKGVKPAKRLLLTGTPIYNQPSDIANLINLAAGKTVLPENASEFDQKYIKRETTYPSAFHHLLGLSPRRENVVKNKEQLREVFHKYIDFHGGNPEGMPQVTDKRVSVPLAKRQQQLYGAMMGQLSGPLRTKVQMGLAPNRRELEKLVPFLSGARMLNNGTAGFEENPEHIVSPKIDQAFGYLKKNLDADPSYKGLVYSNYIENGINPYKALLDKHQIPYGEFTGEADSQKREQQIQDYNAGKLRALLVSSAGAEGLDLKGTRLVQLLEPHFNNEKIKQVVGRAARYRSHDALPEDQRNVEVQHYLSQMPRSLIDRLLGRKPVSTDEYLQNLADDKERLSKQFIDLIK